jgi:hypothetical protein
VGGVQLERPEAATQPRTNELDADERQRTMELEEEVGGSPVW